MRPANNVFSYKSLPSDWSFRAKGLSGGRPSLRKRRFGVTLHEWSVRGEIAHTQSGLSIDLTKVYMYSKCEG